MNSEIRDKLVKFIVQNYLFGDESGTPEDTQSLLESGVIDSTGVLELVEFLEDEFGIQVLDNETVPENLDTVANLVTYVSRKQQS